MNLNLICEKSYYSDGNNKYYRRIENFSREAPYEIKWQVWCDRENDYVDTEEKTQNKLEKELRYK